MAWSKITQTYCLPCRDLLVVPDSGRVGETARLWRDECRLGDEKRTGNAGALGVVLYHQVCRNVGSIVAIAGERGEDDAVGERDVAHTYGSKKRRGRRHRTLWSWDASKQSLLPFIFYPLCAFIQCVVLRGAR